jgi:glutaredoxin
MSSEYIVLGLSTCTFCTKAKELLESKDIEYTYRDISNVNPDDISALKLIAGTEFSTVPQIFKYKQGGGLDYIGGYTQLNESFQVI